MPLRCYDLEMDTAHVTLTAPQRRVLVAVKRRGEATADELATDLDISASGVRQHLSALRSAGFITARQERGQPGRPADHYQATVLTEPLFVTSDSTLSIELLSHIEEEDPELVGKIFDRRRRRMVEVAQPQLLDRPFEERIGVLTELLDDQGYLADFEQVEDGHYRINLHNCAIWPVANRYKQACNAELDYLRDLIPDANVERATHKTAGAHTCAYEIRVQQQA